MSLPFRNLLASEIETAVSAVNSGGVKIQLKKANFATQHILDESVGILNWRVTFPDKHCRIEIWDETKKEWVGREHFLEVEKNTVQASLDAISDTGTIWGIGQELDSAPEIFFYAADLKNYKYNPDSKNGYCTDLFRVSDVKYNDKKIVSITVEVMENAYSGPYYTKTFLSKEAKQSMDQTQRVAEDVPDTLEDDQEIVIGYLSGKKYGEVKGTDEFNSLLRWIRNATPRYSSEDKIRQFLTLKKMAAKMFAAEKEG